MDSILTSVKKLSGIAEEYEHFDDQVISYINSVFFTLRQLGVGPASGFVIEDDLSTWSEFIPDDIVLRQATKAYVSAKVRLEFDPPTASAHLNALLNTIKEYEWRLNVEVETPMN